MAVTDIQHIVGSTAPARAAIRMMGTLDEAFLIDVFAAARVTAGDVAGTFTAWVNIPDILGDYGIISCGDTAAIEFLTLSVVTGKVSIEINLATALKCHHVTTNVVITPHKWHHIAVVQNASINAPKIYVDGLEVATTMTDETDNGVWFDELDLIDDGSIGAAEEAGAAGQVKECVGGISDVKYYAIELTDDEVEADYNGDATKGTTDLTRKTTITTAFTDHWPMVDLVNVITAANNGIKGATILYCNAYSEFTSRLFTSAIALLSADNVSLSVSNETAHLLIVKAA